MEESMSIGPFCMIQGACSRLVFLHSTLLEPKEFKCSEGLCVNISSALVVVTWGLMMLQTYPLWTCRGGNCSSIVMGLLSCQMSQQS